MVNDNGTKQLRKYLMDEKSGTMYKGKIPTIEEDARDQGITAAHPNYLFLGRLPKHVRDVLARNKS